MKSSQCKWPEEPHRHDSPKLRGCPCCGREAAMELQIRDFPRSSKKHTVWECYNCGARIPEKAPGTAALFGGKP